MKITRAELLDKLQRAFEIEEVMVGFLTDLAGPHALASKIPEPDRQKVHKMLAIIHADTLDHRKIVAGMIEDLSEKPRGA